MRVLIVDDEPFARLGVRSRLDRHHDIKVIGECDNGDTALDTILRDLPDLVIMDIEMPDRSGLDVINAVPAPARPMTIFLTAFDRFAVSAFEIPALDYLLKPIDDARLDESLDRARTAASLRDGAAEAVASYASRLSVRTGSRVSFIETAEISWIEGGRDYSTVHAGERSLLLPEPLHKLADRLNPRQFVRVHRSTILNIDRVVETRRLANRDAVTRLQDGTPLRISRTYASFFEAAIANRNGQP